jgi:hypothetical protein
MFQLKFMILLKLVASWWIQLHCRLRCQTQEWSLIENSKLCNYNSNPSWYHLRQTKPSSYAQPLQNVSALRPQLGHEGAHNKMGHFCKRPNTQMGELWHSTPASPATNPVLPSEHLPEMFRGSCAAASGNWGHLTQSTGHLLGVKCSFLLWFMGSVWLVQLHKAPMPGMPMPPGSTKKAVWRCGFAQKWLI